MGDHSAAVAVLGILVWMTWLFTWEMIRSERALREHRREMDRILRGIEEDRREHVQQLRRDARRNSARLGANATCPPANPKPRSAYR